MAEVLLVTTAAVALAWVILLVVAHASAPAFHFASVVGHSILDPIVEPMATSGWHRRRRALLDEIDEALGQGRHPGGVRTDIVLAAHQAQQITIMDQKLRKSVRDCLQTHWAVANAISAVHMSEAASHPLSEQLRQRNIDLALLTSTALEQYPLLVESPDLIRLQLGIQNVAVWCATCPYRVHLRSDAPAVCPSAQALGNRAKGAGGQKVP